MSLYLIVFIALVFFTFLEFFSHIKLKNTYTILLILVTILLCLRYGQGQDYFSYYWHYDNCLVSSERLEIGWNLLTSLFRFFNIPFEVFIAVLSFADMALLNRFIVKYCNSKIFSLTFAYPTIILTYFCSGLREGFVIAIFLGILFEYLLQEKYFKYVVGVLVCLSFHKVSFLLLIFPLLIKFSRSTKQTICLAISSLIIGFGLFFTGLVNYLPYGADGISVMSIVERFLTFIILLFVISNLNDDVLCKKTFDIYKYGTFLYGVFLGTAVTASRIAILFKSLEVLLFSNIVSRKNKAGWLTFIFAMLLTCFMFNKNINSYIEQGEYSDDINVLNYPYVSVFNEKEIVDLRSINDSYFYLVE